MRLRPAFPALLTLACVVAAAVPSDYWRLDGARNGAYLRYGMQGLEVLALQHALIAASVPCPETSTFDTTTLSAVRAFQQRSGVTVDGVVGPQTVSALDRALGVQPPRGIPQRPSGAMSGSAFMTATWTMDRTRRESSMLTELSRGNLPPFERRFMGVTVTDAGPDGVPHTVTYQVMPDYLAIGSDTDFVRIPANPLTAQRVADQFGCSLPTRKMVNQIWRAAAARFAPIPMTPGPQMMSNAYFQEHNRRIELQRAGRPLGLLLGGTKKDVVISNRLLSYPTRVAIYGWHQLNGSPIQPLSTVHENTYADYSHGIRLVKKAVVVDGRTMDIVDVLRSVSLSYLLSDEGRMPTPRIPGVPEPR